MSLTELTNRLSAVQSLGQGQVVGIVGGRTVEPFGQFPGAGVQILRGQVMDALGVDFAGGLVVNGYTVYLPVTQRH